MLQVNYCLVCYFASRVRDHVLIQVEIAFFFVFADLVPIFVQTLSFQVRDCAIIDGFLQLWVSAKVEINILVSASVIYSHRVYFRQSFFWVFAPEIRHTFSLFVLVKEARDISLAQVAEHQPDHVIRGVVDKIFSAVVKVKHGYLYGSHQEEGENQRPHHLEIGGDAVAENAHLVFPLFDNFFGILELFIEIVGKRIGALIL